MDGSSGPLARPLFPRTLLALKAVAAAFAVALKGKTQVAFAQGIGCIAARGAPPGDQDDQKAAHVLRPEGEVKLTVTAWPVDTRPPDRAPPAVTLIVADEHAVQTEILPADLARTLTDPSSDDLVAEGRQRADAAMRATGLSADPRTVLLARVNESYLTIRSTEAKTAASNADLPASTDGSRADLPRAAIGDAEMPPPHVDWLFVPWTKLGVSGWRSMELRRVVNTDLCFAGARVAAGKSKC